MTATGCGTGADAGAVTVVLDVVDVTALSDAELDGRIRRFGNAENRLSGLLAQSISEKKRRSGAYVAAETLKTKLRQSGRLAHRSVRDAEQLDGLKATQNALIESRITPEHAHILVQPPKPVRWTNRKSWAQRSRSPRNGSRPQCAITKQS